MKLFGKVRRRLVRRHPPRIHISMQECVTDVGGGVKLLDYRGFVFRSVDGRLYRHEPNDYWAGDTSSSFHQRLDALGPMTKDEVITFIDKNLGKHKGKN